MPPPPYAARGDTLAVDGGEEEEDKEAADAATGVVADSDACGVDGDAMPASCRSFESTNAMFLPCTVCSTGRRGEPADGATAVGVRCGDMGGVVVGVCVVCGRGAVSRLTTGSSPSSAAVRGGGARMGVTELGQGRGRWVGSDGAV